MTSATLRLQSARTSLSRRLISSVTAVILLTAGLVGLDGVATTTTARAAGPLTGVVQPSAAFPMLPGATLLAFSATDEQYWGDGPQKMYAYTRAGESFQAVVVRTSVLGSASTNWDTTMTVTSPSGAVSTQIVPANARAASLWGFPSGTLPSEEGIWTMELRAASAAPGGRMLLRSYSGVFDGATEMRGRMWSERLHLFQPTTNNEIPLHFMSSLGYVYKADYRGYWGLNSYISADAVGNVSRDSDGVLDCSTSLYRTVDQVSPTEAPALGRCGGAFRVFWQKPFMDDAPGSIPAVTSHAGASASAWVNPQVEAPVFDLTNFVGDDDTIASGDLVASVDNFFGGVEIDVFDVGGIKVRSFTVNVAEGTLPREVNLHFDGLDDGGNPIPRNSIATFSVSGLNAGEIHFTLGDVERLYRGMTIEVLNGPTAGTAEASRIYWADSDGYDGTAANCNVPDSAIDTFHDGYLSGGHANGFGTRCWGGTSGSGWGDTRIVDTWAKQGVASTSSITLHDPQADYTLEKSVNTTGAALPGATVGYTLTITNTSSYDLWDLYDVVDDLSGILDDADFNDDAVVSQSWSGLPEPGFTTFDATAETLTYRGNIPAGQTVTVAYSVDVREGVADRVDSVLDNTVTGPAELPPLPCDVAGCRATSTPIKDVRLEKVLDGAPSQNGDGTWNVTYLLDVGNDGGVTEPYALVDAFDFGAGISALDATVAAAIGSTPAPAGTWNGETETQVIATSVTPGATHRFRVTARVAVAAGVTGTTAAACATSGAGGFANSATLSALSAPVVTVSDSACAVPSRPSLQKDLMNSAQNPDGSWILTYRVLVTNTSANVLNYDLSDTLRFAAATTVTDASIVSAPGGVTVAVPAWNGETETTVAQDVILPAATAGVPSIHEYVVVATAAIDGTPDFTSPEWQCPVVDSLAPVAFNNSAELSSGADTFSDSACGLPINPSVYKYISSQPVQQPDGSWSLSYDIRVANSAEDPVGGLAYSLEDMLHYPDDVAVNSITVTGPSGIALNSDFTGGLSEVGGVVVSPVTALLADPSAMVPAAADSTPGEQVFVVTVNVNVPTGLDGLDLTCGASGSSGFLNTVVMTAAANGGLEVPASACADITVPATASIVKSVISSSQADDGSWILIYGLDVTNSDPLLVTSYLLSDSLDFGTDVAIGSADVTDSPAAVTLATPVWNGETNPVIARAVPIAAGTVHHYEVTVAATPAVALYGSPDAACATGGSGGTRGFRNTASVSTGIDGPSTSSACTPMLAPRLSVTKDLTIPAGATVTVGDTVAYTVTAKNEGDGTFTAINPAWVIDDLSGVLDDAGYDGNAAATAPGTIAYTAPRLSWSGVLRPGASVELNYTVTITAAGDLLLRNVAFAGDSACAPGDCVTPEVQDCTTSTCDFTETRVVPPIVPAGELGSTGVGDIRLLVILGMLALGAGGLAAGFGLRSRSRYRSREGAAAG